MSYESVFSIYSGIHSEIDRIFQHMVRFNASDLHIKAGAPPFLRIGGSMRGLDMPFLNNEQCEKLVFAIMNEQQIEKYRRDGDIDFTHMLSEGQRFRINVFRERGTLAMAARLVPVEIPTFADLGLPPETLRKICEQDSGIVLLSGVTGSGKSTTIAAMIDHINSTRRCHIITIEDPIEYLYKDKKSFINQREIGSDLADFSQALRNLVRQDPDVIVAGEMRDYETFNFGLTAAETGHLVFGTMHASSAPLVIPRILDLFPADRHDQVRQNLAFTLRAVICQRLLPSSVKGRMMVPALEIMLGTPTVGKMILEGKENKLAEVIRGSRDEGMIDFNHSLADLIKKGYISKETGMDNTPNREALSMILQGIDLSDEGGIIKS
ncbi:MAG: type IV pilus twitching motility protein PilT [Planctomycetota bacterium]